MPWGDVLGIDQNAAVVKATAGDGDGHAGERGVVALCVGDEDQEQRCPTQRYRLHTVCSVIHPHTCIVHPYTCINVSHSAIICTQFAVSFIHTPVSFTYTSVLMSHTALSSARSLRCYLPTHLQCSSIHLC